VARRLKSRVHLDGRWPDRSERRHPLCPLEIQPVCQPEPGGGELFDLLADPDETVDLIAMPEHAALLDEMRTKVETYRAALSRPSRWRAVRITHDPGDDVLGK